MVGLKRGRTSLTSLFFKFEKFILHCSLAKISKHNQISIDIKCKILAVVDENKSPKAEIARKFGIQKSMLFTILKKEIKF